MLGHGPTYGRRKCRLGRGPTSPTLHAPSVRALTWPQGCRDCGQGFGGGAGGEDAADAGALVQAAVDLDPAAVEFDEALDQGQAEAGAGLAGLGIGALEAAEDTLLIAGRDADAGIGHRQDEGAADAFGRDQDSAAGGREFNGVAD